MKNIVKLTESQLKKVISESVKSVLRENYNEDLNLRKSILEDAERIKGIALGLVMNTYDGNPNPLRRYAQVDQWSDKLLSISNEMEEFAHEKDDISY